MASSNHAEVVVVGGGIIGAAVSRELALRGTAVLALERDQAGAHASWAAAGMLSPLAEAVGPGPFLDLLLAARRRFPELAVALREETGIDVGYLDAGTLFLSLREEDDGPLEARLDWQRSEGLCVERLSAREILELEPAVNDAVRWGLRYPEDHQVENRALTRALWLSARNAAVALRTGAEVAHVEADGGRVRGVRLEDGTLIEADRVVLAAGCWTGRIGGLPRAVPVRPVHGQITALEAPLPVLRHVVDSPRCYLVPRADGRLLVGTTVEDTGFARKVTADAVRRLLDAAAEIAPVTDRLPTAESWSGLRPGTPDDLPILGPDPRMAGLFYATGHFRNGILLAPLTGELVADAVLGDAPALLAPFGIDRFLAP